MAGLTFLTLALLATVESRPPHAEWETAVHDPAVESRILMCGTENEPAGTGMPSWPEGAGDQTYTRQYRNTKGDLQVEVWVFGNPSLSLLQADRQIEGHQIIVKTRWGAPPDSPMAACYAKLGARITFHGLPNPSYTIVTE